MFGFMFASMKEKRGKNCQGCIHAQPIAFHKLPYNVKLPYSWKCKLKRNTEVEKCDARKRLEMK